MAVVGSSTAAVLSSVSVVMLDKHEPAGTQFPLFSVTCRHLLCQKPSPFTSPPHPLLPTNLSKNFCLEGNSRLISLMVRIVLGQDF